MGLVGCSFNREGVHHEIHADLHCAVGLGGGWPRQRRQSVTGNLRGRCGRYLERCDFGKLEVDANWTNVPALGGFPNNGNGGVATYSATIGPVGSPYTVTLSTNVTIENLVLNSVNATLSQTSGTLIATGAITLSTGTYQLQGGTITNTTLNETGGTLAIRANNANLLSGVTVNGDLSLNTDRRGTQN